MKKETPFERNYREKKEERNMRNGGSKSNSFPLSTTEIHPRAKPTRVHIVAYMCAILALLYHHLLRPRSLPSFLMFVADLILAFMWTISQAFRYRPIRRKEYPENLSRAVDDDDLPSLDVFICTADPYKEPPMDTANTALSVLAFDYPTNKISVYVSDDGGSQLTLFALMEASRFAKHWLPFCKKHQISKRCPEEFFNGGDHDEPSQDDWAQTKILYERMKARVERVMEQGNVDDDMIASEEEREAFQKWMSGFSRQDHPTIIQVLLEGDKDVDASGQCVPNLIYLSREKRKIFHHNFKAGALNVLIRVSAIMTNAPVVLSLDCDNYSNDPQAPRLALCHLLDPIEGPKLAFVQFPQRYKGINRSDIYNNEFQRARINAAGLDGLGVTNYVGTGSFIRRKALYGGPTQLQVNGLPGFNNGDAIDQISIRSKPTLDAAHRVAACNYELGTNWGLTMGFRYGTLVEDFFTGYHLQCEGWCSALCDPPTPAFLGGFPITLNDTLMQLKRWFFGFLEVAFSKHCPFTFGTRRRSLLMGLGYGFYSLWSFWSIPILTYGILPQLGLLYDIYMFPKVSSGWIYLYIYLFLASYTQDLVENLLYGITFRKWWNEQRMWMIKGTSSYLFALVEFSLKVIGASALDFNVTCKALDDEQQRRYDQEIFDFGVKTPMFVPLSTVAVINLVSFTWGIVKLMRYGNIEDMFVQLFISGFVVVNAWPVYEAMVLRRDGGRIPRAITSFSILLACAICYVAAFALK